MSLPVAPASQPIAPRNTGAVKSDDKRAATADDKKFSFRDLIDIVNPLQHIPVVSTIYREITGDEIKNTSRIMGGALFGGIIGAAIGAVNAIAVDATGDDVGQLAMHKLGFGDKSGVAKATDNVAPTVQLAQNDKNNMADKNGIVWDTPAVAMAETKHAPVTGKSVTGTTPDAAPAIDNTPVITVTPPAMPAPKELSALPVTPAQADAARVASVPKDLGKDMLTALSKYEAMQKLNKTPQDMRVALNTDDKRPTEFVNKLRRYN